MDVDESKVVDSAKCPHCEAEFDEPNVMNSNSDAMELVCPNCDTMIGASTGVGGLNELLAILLSDSVEDAKPVLEALQEMHYSDSPGDVSDESLEIINDRM
jgi:DNA-directed RNA polymerase subunit RPC12/RpoP